MCYNNGMKAIFFVCLAAVARLALGLTLETQVPGLDFARLECANPAGWTFDWNTETDKEGVSTLKIRMSAPDERTPPKFSVRLGLPGTRADHVWSAFDDRYMLYAVGFDAENRYESQLAYRTPLITVFDDDNRNTIALACSEALRKLKFGIGISERTCVLRGAFHFFDVEEPPMKDYAAEIRVDPRGCFWAKAVSEASDWIVSVNGFAPCRVPETAFDPLYSSWYAFWQDVDAKSIEKEIPIAASLGMKTAILDDGWQKKESASFYSATGDWMPFEGTFPDMKRHVDFVHRTGLKYMLWLSVPYVGDEASAWKRFEGKFLRVNGEKSPGRVGVLDPRFPEVREYLIGTYERILRDWGYDGLKLDFIDQFVIKGEDPAVGQKFAGRDIRSLPLAVDRLMKDVVKRLSAINPDVLLEFRQQYMGPAIRQYGNMIRATDSPADSDRIRKQIADLRLTSGNTAVHADMLAWSRAETPERAARPILNSLFSVIQYSMRLDGLPESHRRVIKNWIGFTQRHRAALVKGAFRPYHPELLYPRLEGESAAEKVIALYSVPQPVDLADLAKPVVLVNATFETVIPVISSVRAKARLFDVFGQEKGVADLLPGMQKLSVPVSGFAEIAKGDELESP